MPSLVEIGPVVLEKIIRFCQCILGNGPQFEHIFDSPSPEVALCQVWLIGLDSVLRCIGNIYCLQKHINQMLLTFN